MRNLKLFMTSITGFMFAAFVGCGNGGPMKIPEYSLINKNISKFWEQPFSQESEPHIAADYMHCIKTGNDYAPQAVKIEIENLENQEVQISCTKDFSDYDTVISDGSTVVFDNLYTATHYFYRVKLGENNYSAIGEFRTAESPRTISIDGLINTRDLGGYRTVNGKRVRQGLVYRGSSLERITKSEHLLNKGLSTQGYEFMRYTLGICFELDLVGSKQESSYKGAEWNFASYTCPVYNLIDDTETIASIIKEFAKKSNYPMYLHCSLGRDRTGEIALLLNALLGVEYKTLVREYELSFFSVIGNENCDCFGGNWRSNQAQAEALLTNFYQIYNTIDNSFSDSKYPLFMDKTEAYLLSIGVLQDEINIIRQIMLEEIEN